MASNTTYSSPKVEMRESPFHGKGLFAREKIDKGELLVDFEGAKGQFISTQEADELFNQGDDLMLQVDDDRFFAATTEGEKENEDHINHSCDPNAGIKGTFKLVAMRNIEKNEEITFDYAMSESSDYSMKCECGSKDCRSIITGSDWKIPELQKRYKGYFSEYLQRKIDQFGLVNS